MGQTRVVFTDATTAEAITVLKSLGYTETADGGSFRNQRSPLRIYSVWGKAKYYPDMLDRIDFTPRIQIHFKCRDDAPILGEILEACVQGLLRLQAKTKFRVFDANTGAEITSSVKTG